MNRLRSFLRVDGAPPLIIGHRGLPSRTPENTMASVRAALDLGVHMIEVDVHLTADDKVVVIHDRTLQRTSTGNGSVRSYVLEELADIDAGSWFDPVFSDQRIPTLREVLQLVGNDADLNIEIKSYRFHRIDPRHLASSVLECISDSNAQGRVICTSFDGEVLEAIRDQDAGAAVGFLPDWINTVFHDPIGVARDVSAAAFICSRQAFRRAHLARAHAQGMAVFVYTVNDPLEARRLSEAGVDGIITDAADKLMASDLIRD